MGENLYFSLPFEPSTFQFLPLKFLPFEPSTFTMVSKSTLKLSRAQRYHLIENHHGISLRRYIEIANVPHGSHKGKIIFTAGHRHIEEEFLVKGDKFLVDGCPYQMCAFTDHHGEQYIHVVTEDGFTMYFMLYDLTFDECGSPRDDYEEIDYFARAEK